MKFTVIFAAILSVSWATKVNPDIPSGKREAGISFHSGAQSLGGQSFGGHSLGAQSFGGQYSPAGYGGQGDSNAISIGAGYSIGGGSPSFGFAPSHDGEGQNPSGHSTIRLAPITLGQGHLASSDLSQLMSQLSESLNSGQFQLAPQEDGQSSHESQETASPQYSLQDPGLQQYAFAHQNSAPSLSSYTAGTKGLSAYSSTGPVLFSPELNSNQYSSASNGGHSFEAAGLSAEHLPAGLSSESFAPSFGGSLHGYGGSSQGLAVGSHSLGGVSHSLGGVAHNLGGVAHNLGGVAHNLGGGAHSLGGRIISNGFGQSYGGKGISLGGKVSLKPVSLGGGFGGSGHGASAPSFGSFSSGHGLSLGSSLRGFSKYPPSTYIVPKKLYSSPADAFSAASHSPPRTTYGIPTASYSGGPSSSLSSSSRGPQYFSQKYPSFSDGSSFKGVSPVRSSLTSYSTNSVGPKYSFGSHSASSSRFAPKDIEGSYSENSYDTIKYSEELKPHM